MAKGKFFWVQPGNEDGVWQKPGKRKRVVSDCRKCGLNKGCKTPRMPTSGKGKKSIFIVAEAPAANEDRRGTPLIGKAGKRLESALGELGIDLDEDCWKTNAVCCRPPNNRKPTDKEVAYCHPRLIREIKAKQPKVVLLLGGSALNSFLLDRWKKGVGGIQKWRGFTIPDQDFGCWALPTYHPSFVMRTEEKQPVVSTIWEYDLSNLPVLLEKPFPDYSNYEDYVHILKTEEQVAKYLEDIVKYCPQFLVFDFETTGLKPDARGHRIATVNMCWQKEKAASWEWKLTPKKLFRQIMKDPKIGKGASNLKMEHHWALKRARVEVQGWMWDSMVAAHVLDNRKGITSLKFLTYVRFGIPDYDSEIEPYLKSYEPNGLNRVFEAPREKLLLYGGNDSLFTFWAAWEQMKEIGAFIND